MNSKKRKINEEDDFDLLDILDIPEEDIFPFPKRIKYEGKIDSLDDIINIIDSNNIYNNINVNKLRSLRPELVELRDLIGLNELKNSIVNQLVYYIQNLHKFSEDYLHTIITGPPGTGKTTVAKILGKLFSKLGILSRDHFQIARRDNLIAGYLGQTALKTQKLLDECKGGVLFIDEVYSLGNPEGRDSYSKEAIDTINLFLSEQKHNFMMIVAGYEDEVEKCFFSYNAGLKRRFMWNHKIEEYTPENLADIFIGMVTKIRWKLDKALEREQLIKFFKENKDKFKAFGGDVEKFLVKVKISHSKRVFPLPTKEKKIINMNDITDANKDFNKKKEEQGPPPFMYI
jgi:SpoVK/Ycf46/Vps4 family AAA+-type ATPase